jgi:hypothetical protein
MRHPLHKLREVRSPWIVLAVLATAQFIDTLDVTIVNVALPLVAKMQVCRNACRRLECGWQR